MKKKLFYYILFSPLWVLQVPAQEKSGIKFGNVTHKDFAVKVYSIDSNANAVVIADIGSSRIEGNNKAWFSLVYKHFKRIHILNKNGYDIARLSYLHDLASALSRPFAEASCIHCHVRAMSYLVCTLNRI